MEASLFEYTISAIINAGQWRRPHICYFIITSFSYRPRPAARLKLHRGATISHENFVKAFEISAKTSIEHILQFRVTSCRNCSFVKIYICLQVYSLFQLCIKIQYRFGVTPTSVFGAFVLRYVENVLRYNCEL